MASRAGPVAAIAMYRLPFTLTRRTRRLQYASSNWFNFTAGNKASVEAILLVVEKEILSLLNDEQNVENAVRWYELLLKMANQHGNYIWHITDFN